MDVSELRACQVIGQHRSTQRKRPKGRPDGDALTAAIIRLAEQYGRYGYRRITRLLRAEGWHVNAKRVQRIWRREGLKVPQKQPKRGRLTHDNTPSFYQRLKCCVDQLRLPPIADVRLDLLPTGSTAARSMNWDFDGMISSRNTP